MSSMIRSMRRAIQRHALVQQQGRSLGYWRRKAAARRAAARAAVIAKEG